ncbi:hypothetical protein GW17_00002962 [Ensete ventricosum]|nr:hypothetical protein GW17_00002962 [Ensete ventricosum]
MPRSSRHRSHRLHKHSRDLSDSEEDRSLRERRIREEEPTASSGARVSRDPELEKRRSSQEHGGKELVVTSNGDASGEHGKKRKERADEVAVADRWNGGEECDHKRSKCEEFGPVELDKSSRSKLLAADSKGRSSRRHEGSNERDENSGGKNDSAKHKSERGADRRESSNQYKDGKARNRIEKDSIKDREVQDSRHDKYDDKHSRKNGSKSGGSTEELTSKKYTTNNGKDLCLSGLRANEGNKARLAWNISKIAESAHSESALEVRLYPNAASKGENSISSGLCDKISATLSGKQTLKDDIHSGELFAEAAASSKCNRTPRSDVLTSPNQSKGRSSSAIINRRFSERSPLKYERFARQCVDIEIGQRSSSSKDGDSGELVLEKPIIDDISQADVCIRESTLGSSSINRSDYVSDCLHNHLPSPLPVRSGADYPAFLDPYQDDVRARSTDHKSSNRYKRIDDLGFIRAHGNAWKGAPSWPFPVTNGFVPLQRRPPPGFHPAMFPFPAPPLFGVRPPIDLTHGGVSYHMHDEAVRYSGHCQPFGWHNPVDQLSHPHMQMWDGSSDMFKDESHIYGRPEWDENSQLKSGRGWEMGSDMWKKERELSTHSLTDELAQSKCLPTGSTGAKQSSATLPVKSAVQSPEKDVIEKTHEPSNAPGDKISNCFGNYFSSIDISPALAGSELYKSLLLLICILFQTNKDGSIVKMKSTSSILNSYFPSAKDIVFKCDPDYQLTLLEIVVAENLPVLLFSWLQRAMFLYQQQNGKAYRKHHVPAPVYSEEKKESPQASANKKVQGDANCASLEKTDAHSTDHIKAGEITDVHDSDCPGNGKDQKSDFPCDPRIHGNSTQGCEVIAEECMMNVSRIHNAPENTH